jgi:mercuric ion transport protein
MRSRRSPKDGLGLVGFGAAACVACCAGPILAFLGGVSIAGLASTAFLGAVGLVVAAAAITAFALVRRGRGSCEMPAGDPVLVAAPGRRPAPEKEEA